MNTPRTPSTRSEIELIIDVTRRLDLAQEHALKCDPKAQPYTTYMHTF
jgi:hypothetical protein